MVIDSEWLKNIGRTVVYEYRRMKAGVKSSSKFKGIKRSELNFIYNLALLASVSITHHSSQIGTVVLRPEAFGYSERSKSFARFYIQDLYFIYNLALLAPQ